MAYAGRLDPMASGKLLVLIGEECKRQQEYHGLDKEYRFEVLFGVNSDSGDVLGVVAAEASGALTGEITLSYPRFSSKTVHGKPLHTWAVEGRLHEINIPSYTAMVYTLTLDSLRTEPFTTVHEHALQKINSLPPVTEQSKAIGNDFRRADVRASWQHTAHTHRDAVLSIATFTCIGSSGLYMRTLAETIAQHIGTTGLAFSIHRSTIGTYDPEGGQWRTTY